MSMQDDVHSPHETGQRIVMKTGLLSHSPFSSQELQCWRIGREW